MPCMSLPADSDEEIMLSQCAAPAPGRHAFRVPVYSAITREPRLQPVRWAQEWRIEPSLADPGAVALTFTDPQGTEYGFFLPAGEAADLQGALALLQARQA